MNAHEKSDPAIVAAKPANKAARPGPNPGVAAAEPVERRAGAEEKTGEPSARRTPSRGSVAEGLDRIRRTAKERKKERFTALLHHVTVETLEDAYRACKPGAAPGTDGVTWEDYGRDLASNLARLCARIHKGSYRPTPSRRVFIPKPDGGRRPLAVAALEDKIVQRAVARVLEAIYEADFLGLSYGFRPGRGAHDAMDALVVALESRKVSHILDADIASFFDTVSQEWLIRFVEHRVGDKRIVRLIREWLRAGVLEDGIVAVAERGTAQGAVISPLLANIYLHYALDLWLVQWRKREALGEVVLVRYADDFIVGFERESDARAFLAALRERLERFALSLHPQKTRLIEFGRYAAERRARRWLGKPETFDFLGFTFICGVTRKGRFQVRRKSRSDRMRSKLREIKEGLARRKHEPIREQGKWLGAVLAGWFRYHAVPTNYHALASFRHHVIDLWRRTLLRRSQRDRTTWERMDQLARDFLPKPRILHGWPSQRFAVKHPRQEPYARIGHVRICAGGAQ